MSQKSKILEFIRKNNGNTEVWNELKILDKGTASDIIGLFYDRHPNEAMNQMKHLDIPV